jgi:hypothetical protein
LQAVDKSLAMINTVWPGNIPGRREVVCKNWFEVSREDHSLDLVIGDGFLTAFRFPENYLRLADFVARGLKPDGLLIIRLFSRAEDDSMEQIHSDLQADRINSFHALKLRLGMLLQQNVIDGVAVADIYQAWKDLDAAFPSLCERAGWSSETVDTIRLYEGRPDRYTFPSVSELDGVWAGQLRRVATVFPTYELGHCCPILAYQPKQA